MVLAGQNESGKSSVLQALYDYERGELLPNAQRSFESDVKYPVIECTYAIDDDDDILAEITEFAFVPSMGATNVHLLMELCIGWGLEWLIVLDDGKTSKNAYKYICNSFFDNRKEEADQKIYMLSGADAIEDAFTVSDLQLVESEAKFPSSKKKSDVVQEHGGKELFARKFLEKVDKQEIKKSSLGKSTVNKFENLFAFIELQFTEQKEQRAKIETDKSFKPVTAGSTQTA